MHLMYIEGPDGLRQYTLKKTMNGQATISAHPARFSPDDKFAEFRFKLGRQEMSPLGMPQKHKMKVEKSLKAEKIEKVEKSEDEKMKMEVDDEEKEEKKKIKKEKKEKRKSKS